MNKIQKILFCVLLVVLLFLFMKFVSDKKKIEGYGRSSGRGRGKSYGSYGSYGSGMVMLTLYFICTIIFIIMDSSIKKNNLYIYWYFYYFNFFFVYL